MIWKQKYEVYFIKAITFNYLVKKNSVLFELLFK